MGIADRKGRQRAEREERIILAARTIAEREGWSAVTIRRLAEEIDYSQPVLYSHFKNRDAIVAAVASEGFREITRALETASRKSTDRITVLENAAVAYLAFARKHPAIYQAMFTLPTSLRFAVKEIALGPSPASEQKTAFHTLAAIVMPTSTDIEVATETFWSTLHGFAELERSGRIRKSARAERLALVVRMMLLC